MGFDSCGYSGVHDIVRQCAATADPKKKFATVMNNVTVISGGMRSVQRDNMRWKANEGVKRVQPCM